MVGENSTTDGCRRVTRKLHDTCLMIRNVPITMCFKLTLKCTFTIVVYYSVHSSMYILEFSDERSLFIICFRNRYDFPEDCFMFGADVGVLPAQNDHAEGNR